MLLVNHQSMIAYLFLPNMRHWVRFRRQFKFVDYECEYKAKKDFILGASVLCQWE